MPVSELSVSMPTEFLQVLYGATHDAVDSLSGSDVVQAVRDE